jgi:hypothetical protein
MLALACQSCAIYDILPLLKNNNAIICAKEDDLTSQKLPCIFYTLGAANKRCYIDPLLLRRLMAEVFQKCCNDCFLPIASNYKVFPLLRVGAFGALTACLKQCYDEKSSFRARLALDLDCAENSAALPLPSVHALFAVICAFLQDHLFPVTGEISFDKEECFIFMGTHADKERSCHVIFPELCFINDIKEAITKSHVFVPKFNELLAPFGFVWDPSIARSGLRWEYGDKWIVKEKAWRGSANVLVGTLNCNIRYFGWEQFVGAIDPLVLVGDVAYDRALSWKVVASAPKRHAVAAPIAAVPIIIASANGDKIINLICNQYPSLAGSKWKRQMKPGGVEYLVPSNNYCPFKGEASDSSGAHQHDSAKLYMFAEADNSVRIYCGVCVGQCVVIESHSSTPSTRDVIAKYNAEYARMGHLVVILPQQNNDGSFTSYKVLTKNQFLDRTANLNAKIKVAGEQHKVAENTYWFRHDEARSYPKGLIFDPSGEHDPGFYNTWTGFNPLVLKQAELMREMSNEELQQCWQHTSSILLKNLCRSDNELYSQVLHFFYDIVQKPQRKTKWGIVIYGPQGCGKGIVMQLILKICGQHGLHGDGDSLTEKWNGSISSSLLIFADEGVTNVTSSTLASLKRLLTEETQVTRVKYMENTTTTTVSRIVVAMNDPPKFIENGDRRWLVMNADQLIDNWDETIAGAVAERESLRGCAAFYLLALRDDGSSFKFTNPVGTKARWEMKFNELTEVQRYVYNILCDDFETCCSVFSPPSIEKYTQFVTDIDPLVVNTKEKPDAISTALRDLGTTLFDGHKKPKDLLWWGFQREYPNSTVIVGKFWQQVLSFFPTKELAFNFERLVLYHKVPTFVCPAKAVFQGAFAKVIGESNDIFNKWRL